MIYTMYTILDELFLENVQDLVINLYDLYCSYRKIIEQRKKWKRLD